MNIIENTITYPLRASLQHRSASELNFQTGSRTVIENSPWGRSTFAVIDEQGRPLSVVPVIVSQKPFKVSVSAQEEWTTQWEQVPDFDIYVSANAVQGLLTIDPNAINQTEPPLMTILRHTAASSLGAGALGPIFIGFVTSLTITGPSCGLATALALNAVPNAGVYSGELAYVPVLDVVRVLPVSGVIPKTQLAIMMKTFFVTALTGEIEQELETRNIGFVPSKLSATGWFIGDRESLPPVLSVKTLSGACLVASVLSKISKKSTSAVIPTAVARVSVGDYSHMVDSYEVLTAGSRVPVPGAPEGEIDLGNLENYSGEYVDMAEDIITSIRKNSNKTAQLKTLFRNNWSRMPSKQKKPSQAPSSEMGLDIVIPLDSGGANTYEPLSVPMTPDIIEQLVPQFVSHLGMKESRVRARLSGSSTRFGNMIAQLLRSGEMLLIDDEVIVAEKLTQSSAPAQKQKKKKKAVRKVVQPVSMGW